MIHTTDNAIVSPGTFQRAEENFVAHQQAIYQDTDRMFAVLMAVQWVAGIAAALWIAPRTWVGTASQTHIHVWAAILLGGAINIFPIALAIKRPGAPMTRYVIATAQMMMSGLLIHLTGGRIETHFHVFGSLAFLAFYRDFRVLIPATVVVAVDHILRGIFWPQSVYGILAASEWRWVEHAGWVLFEDAVLFVAIRRSVAEMWDIAVRSSQMTDLNEGLEQRVGERTAETVSINNGLQREIGERELAESALRQSEERYRLLFESNPQPMWVYDNETLAFLAVNQAAINHYGYSREEFLAMSIKDIRPGTDIPALIDQTVTTVPGLNNAGIWKHRQKNGMTIDVEITSHRLDFAGRAARLVLVTDITERKRMEEERQAMFEIIQSISATKNLDELLKLIHEAISKLVYAENCFVALHDPATDLMHFPFWVDHHDPCPAPRPTGKGFSSYILRTGEPILLDRELTDEFVRRGEVQKSGTSSASWLGIPLRTPARTIGVLVFQHYEDENAYSQRDLGFLMSVGGQVAVAIERKRTEEALQVSEAQHRSIFDNATMGIYRSTVDGKFVTANRAFAQMLGYDSVEEVLQCDLERDMYYHPGQRANLIAERFPSGTAEGVEVLWKKKDRTPIWVNFNAKAIADEQGNTAYFDTCIHDVTKRVRAEESLQEANERALKDYEQFVERIAALGQTLGNARDLTAIFQALRDFAVVSVPCDGLVISLYDQEKENRRAAYCWTDGREFDPKDVSAIPVRDGITGRAIKSGSVVIDNSFHRSLQATPTVVAFGERAEVQTPRSALSAPMTVMGRTVGCVEVQAHESGRYQQEHATAMRMAASLAATAVENVSLIEREQAKEEQLRQSQKMEAVGKLAGGIAHDFNNLLTAITGYSELTLRELDVDSPFYSKVMEIKKAGERAASLTRQLLAFSRKQILQPKVLDLNAVIPEMEKMLRRLIGEDIVLETVLDRSLGQVKADPGQMEQILLNLCVNARDAMPEGGRLTIQTTNVSLKQPYRNQQVSIRAGNYVMLSVSDNGCGMDAETQARIFEPFFTTKELGKGTGLGLSTVYGIVKQSDGTIWVYSEVDKGTTFKIYLPRVDEVRAAEAPAELHVVPRGNETILVVEDEDVVRTLATEILKSQGYRVLSAANGEEGLRVCKEFYGAIDLLITDVVMPHMSGRELAEQVATIRPDTRVLYMSGFTDDAIVRHGVLDDGVFFIQKPFSPDALAIKARSVIDHFAKSTSALNLESAVTDPGEVNGDHAPAN